MSSLANSGAISRSMFSLKLQDYTSQSKMFVGGYDNSSVFAAYPSSANLTNLTASNLICWMSVNSVDYWQVSFQYAMVGNTTITPESTNLVFDSGSSINYIPYNDYTTLYNAVTKNGKNSCTIDSASGSTYCSCTSISDSNYPSITLKMGDRYLFYLNNTNYLLWDPSMNQCILTFIQETDQTQKFWLLGDPIYRSYYIIHDMDNQRVGLAGANTDLG